MRYFITGASGWIGSAVVSELLDHGDRVLGLARSDAAAAAIAAAGGEVQRGDLTDLDALRAGAAATDGIVHLGYSHDFSKMAEAAAQDRAAIAVMGEALVGTDRPLLMAAGVLGLAQDRPATEADVPDPSAHPRVANGDVAMAFAPLGVRPVLVRFAPTVHGPGDHGFISTLVGVARQRGLSGYVGDGANRWPAVHRLDAAVLVRLALGAAAAGTVVHAVAEEGVATKAIAEAIGRGLGVPVASVSPEDADEHFGWIGRFFAADAPASSALTRERLGWVPSHPTLLEDLATDAYFAVDAPA